LLSTSRLLWRAARRQTGLAASLHRFLFVASLQTAEAPRICYQHLGSCGAPLGARPASRLHYIAFFLSLRSTKPGTWYLVFGHKLPIHIVHDAPRIDARILETNLEPKQELKAQSRDLKSNPQAKGQSQKLKAKYQVPNRAEVPCPNPLTCTDRGSSVIR
jgi:hypothetical protein